MNNTIYQLFVYGSLRSGFRNPVYHYLTRYFHLVGEAVVKGNLYGKGEFPVARPTEEDKFISGELYAVNSPSEFSWAIEQLDDYEGINVEAGETPLYKREATTAYIKGVGSTAWVYWFNGDVTDCPVIESGDLLQYLQQKNKPDGSGNT